MAFNSIDFGSAPYQVYEPWLHLIFIRELAFASKHPRVAC